MKLNLYSVKEHIALLIFILFSFWGNAQTTLLHYTFNNTLAPSTDIVNPVDNLTSPTTATYTANMLRANTSGYNVDIVLDASDYDDLSLRFTGQHSPVNLGMAFWDVYVDPDGNGYQQIDSRVFLSGYIPFVGIVNPAITYNVDLSAYDRNSNLKIRLSSSIIFSGHLRLSNVIISGGSPKVEVLRNVVPNNIIAHTSSASIGNDTDFGTLKTVGESLTKTYRIRNTGSSDLIISSIDTDGSGDFSATLPSPTTIAVGAFRTFTVTFDPANEGIRSTNVRIFSNGSPSPYLFNVKGYGVSCKTNKSTYAINNMEVFGTQTIPSDITTFPRITGTSSPATSNSLGVALFPNGKNLYNSENTSWLIRNTTSTVIFGPLDISNQKEVKIAFNIAAFVTSGGMANSDYIRLAVWNPGTGIYSNEVQLRGAGSNKRYGFDATGIIEATYDGLNDFELFNTDVANASNYARLELTIPPTYGNSLTFRITGISASAARMWLIDDVQVLSGNDVYKTWDGATWVDGAPDIDEKVVFTGNYNFSGAENHDLNACECEVNAGATLTIPAGRTLQLRNRVVNHGAANNFIVKDGGNLIQTQNDISNSGNIQVEKVFNFSSGRQQYNYVISPTVGTNIKSLYTGVIDNNISALYYNQATNYFGVSNGAYIPGRSLAVKEPSTGTNGGHASTPAKFIGVPANGVINYALAYSNNAGGATKSGYNLVGNPYPSNLDLIALYNANNARIMPTFQFWDNRGNLATTQQGNTYGGESYAKFNALNETGVNATAPASAASPPRTPTRYVSPVQGFIVQARSTANGQNLVFSNTNMRVSNAATQFFGKTAQKTESNRYWLSFITPTDLEYSSAVVYFEGGSNAFGTDDSHASESSDNIYTMADENKISIHGRPIFNGEDVVPLGYTAFAAGSYKIALQNKEGVFNNGQGIYLKDKALNVVTNLTEGAYQFDTQAGDFTGRFEIIYQQEATLLTSNVVKEGLQVFRNGQDFVVRAKSSTIDFIELYDISGRLQQKIKGNQKEVTIPAAYLNNGVYVLKISLNGEWQTRKILK